MAHMARMVKNGPNPAGAPLQPDLWISLAALLRRQRPTGQRLEPRIGAQAIPHRILAQ